MFTTVQRCAHTMVNVFETMFSFFDKISEHILNILSMITILFASFSFWNKKQFK